jgi:glutathione synthase/RimK-type ligase-like ATP-grasp enzyme
VVVDEQMPEDAAELSTKLLDRLSLSTLPSHVVAYSQPGELVIGPSIGILSNPRWNEKARTIRPSKQLPALCKLLETAAAQGALCFLMRARDVDFATKQVKAYLWMDGNWQHTVLPLPDVVYDQVLSRKVEFDEVHATVRQRLSQMYGTRIFNDGFFDKLEVYEWLARDSLVRSHVPDTVRYTRLQDAAVFIQRNPCTFLKPVHGSLGLGIIRFTHQPDGSISYAAKRAAAPPLQGKSANAVEALRTFRKRLAARPYLLQRGIDLATYQDRPFDIRILLQRDGSGEWRRTKAFARVAPPGEFTSNLSSGGEALPVDTILSAVFPSADQQRRCRRLIHRLSRHVADAIERESGKVFGELGLDIGVDGQGGVWIIEVNSKPRKTPVTERGRQDLVDLAFARPVEYALYLARAK